MLEKILKKFKLNRKHSYKEIKYNNITEELDKKDFDITVAEINNFLKIEISDFITINDYIERLESAGRKEIINLISNSVLWNSGEQRVNKGTFYVIKQENKLYNILIDNRNEMDERIKIDERIKKEDIIEEKIISIKNNRYSLCINKHDKTGNTFFTKFYGINLIPGLELSEEEAFSAIESVVLGLESINGIKNILDIDLLKNEIFKDIFKSEVKIKK